MDNDKPLPIKKYVVKLVNLNPPTYKEMVDVSMVDWPCRVKKKHVEQPPPPSLRDVSTLTWKARAPRIDMTKAVMPMVAVEIIIPKSQGA